MNKKFCIIFSILFTLCLNIFAGESVLRYTVTAAEKSNPALTNAVVSSDTADVCCIYTHGQNYTVDNDGNVKLFGDYSFSPTEAGLNVIDAGGCRIKGQMHSYSKISLNYTVPDMQGGVTVKAADKGTQSVKVLKNAMVKAIKKSKSYKKIKKSKRGFKGMIYPMNQLHIKVGGTGVSVSETFYITSE